MQTHSGILPVCGGLKFTGFRSVFYRSEIRVFDWADNNSSPLHICPSGLPEDQNLLRNQTYSLDKTDIYTNKQMQSKYGI